MLLLVPLLEFIGLSEGSGPVAGMAAQISELFHLLRLPKTLPAVLGVFLVLVCLREALLRFHTVQAATMQHGFVLYLQERFYRAITYTSWLFFTRARPSDFNQVLTGDINRIGQGTHHLVGLASNGVTLVVYVFMALWLSPSTTAITAACGLVMSLLLRRRMQRAQHSGRASTRAAKDLYGAIAEHLGGMKAAKSFGAEARHVEEFVRLIGAARHVALEFIGDNAGAKMWFYVGSTAIFCVCLYAAVEVFAISAVSLLLLLFVFGRMMPLAANAQQSYQHLLHMLPAFSSYGEMEVRCVEAAEGFPGEVAEPPGFESEIRLRQVGFAYRADRDVLSGVDLVIPARQTTALVGPSGAGKSTIADLLMGLLLPDSGEIVVDGRVLREVDLPVWRRCCGYVPQEVFLFHDTVRANLVWACPEAGEEEIWRALEEAAAADFVRHLPRGIETEIGERGVRLSGGERQRLALARALLIRPRLLILDEATSNLDVENERQIQRALAALRGRTSLVVIAHRLSTVRYADQIAVVEDGRVMECGSWTELHSRADSRLAALSRVYGQSAD